MPYELIKYARDEAKVRVYKLVRKIYENEEMPIIAYPKKLGYFNSNG